MEFCNKIFKKNCVKFNHNVFIQLSSVSSLAAKDPSKQKKKKIKNKDLYWNILFSFYATAHFKHLH